MTERRRRSGIADTKAEVAKLTLVELNAEIERCLWGFENGGTSRGRRSFYKRLVWLEKEREALFAIPAK
jgi:hypothetical protein